MLCYEHASLLALAKEEEDDEPSVWCGVLSIRTVVSGTWCQPDFCKHARNRASIFGHAHGFSSGFFSSPPVTRISSEVRAQKLELLLNQGENTLLEQNPLQHACLFEHGVV